MATPQIMLGDRTISSGHTPYVIAEIGANHNGDMSLAKEMISAAKESGADAAKFQSWSEDSLISDAEYERNTSYDGDEHRHFGTLREMVRAYQLSRDQHFELKQHCDSVGIHFMSSAFSSEEVDLLAEVGSAALKIASMDINYLDLIEKAASAGLPLIISTGMADMSEIAKAVEGSQRAGAQGNVCVLHCVSEYPAPPTSLNLRNLTTLQQAFPVPVGFSDHTAGIHAAVAAVALGACVIEKHFTTDTSLPGWDHQISVEPAEMVLLTTAVRETFDGLGRTDRAIGAAELAKRASFRRCAVLLGPQSAGTEVSRDMVTFKRPGTGISPDSWSAVAGRRLQRDCADGHELNLSDFVG